MIPNIKCAATIMTFYTKIVTVTFLNYITQNQNPNIAKRDNFKTFPGLGGACPLAFQQSVQQ